MAIRIEKENQTSRTAGNKVVVTSPVQVIYKGTLLASEKNAVTGEIEVRTFLAADVATLTPMGLAIDQNVLNPIQAADGNTVGDGYDYSDFSRGGLVAAIDDATLWVKGNSLVKADDTWAIGTAVYWDGTALLYTDVSTSNIKVGKLEDKIVAVGGDVTELRIKLVKFA